MPVGSSLAEDIPAMAWLGEDPQTSEIEAAPRVSKSNYGDWQRAVQAPPSLGSDRSLKEGAEPLGS